MMIGKHVGRTMSALGGRLGAYRRAAKIRPRAALQRNLYRGEADPETLEWAASGCASGRAAERDFRRGILDGRGGMKSPEFSRCARG